MLHRQLTGHAVSVCRSPNFNIIGIRDDFGWTIAIMEDTGRMVLTASGDLVGDVAFGVCTPC